MSRALPEPFHREMSLRPHSNEFLAVLVFAVAIALAAIGMTRGTRAAVPNTVARGTRLRRMRSFVRARSRTRASSTWPMCPLPSTMRLSRSREAISRTAKA
jgi:hypothetical protein